MDESLIPIDIHASKLLDWLVSRRHCGKDWMKSLTQIRQNILQALRDMPENESIALILSSGSQLNYYTCREIVDVLKQTEADSKNIFGYYSSQRMKDWQDIVRMYEKDNVYLAEIAQTIVRNVTYEVPSLRKQVTKVDTTIEGLRKKQSDCIKRSNQLLSEHAAYRTELGIRGEDAGRELAEQLSHFPSLISQIGDKLTSLKSTVVFYKEFVQATTNGSPILCPLIEYLTTKGNTTYFEYVTGQKPDVIEQVQPDIAGKRSESPSHQEEGIDFGTGIDYGDGIDFGEGIDFGDNGSGSAGTGTSGSNGDGFVHVRGPESQRSSEDEINWDTDAHVSLIEPNTGSKVARGVDAHTVIEYRGTRDIILHELLELECFLQQRIYELNQVDDGLANLLLGSKLTPFATDFDTHNNMMHLVRQVLQLLTSDRLKMMYNIRENPKFCESIVRKLKQKTELAEKSMALVTLLKEQEQQLMREKLKVIAQIPVLIEVTAKLEDKLTEDISARYKNRPVNIMAGAQIL